MKRYSDTVLKTVTGGFTTPASGATVQVNVTGAGLATIYSDDGITTTANPLTTDVNGRYSFFVANGRYDLQFSGTGFVTYTLTNVEITDAMDTTALGKTAIAFTANNTHAGTETFAPSGVLFSTANAVTLTVTNPAAPRTYTIPDFGASDSFVSLTATQTLTNKTLDTAGPNTVKINGNTLSAAAGTATVTIPNTTDTLVNLTGAQTLTSKTLTAPVINGGSINPSSLLLNATAPTILTHFNTSGDSIAANGSAAFQITVGTGTANNTGGITLPSAALGWVCTLTNQTRAALILQTANTTTNVTFTNFGTTFAATNWTNGDLLQGTCFAR